MIKLVRKIIHDIIMLMMPKWLKKRAMSCSEAAHRLSENDQINLAMKLKLKMHVMICQHCTDYETQLNIIHKTAKDIPKVDLADNEIKQINDSKNNIIRQLNSKK